VTDETTEGDDRDDGHGGQHDVSGDARDEDHAEDEEPTDSTEPRELDRDPVERGEPGVDDGHHDDADRGTDTDRRDADRDVKIDRQDADRDVRMDRQDGVEREVGGEPIDDAERSEGVVHDGSEEERGERLGEPARSSEGAYADVPQYFDPAAETSDDLPRTAESSRSEMIGLRRTEGGRSPVAKSIDDEAAAHAGLERARTVANALDSAVTVPGTSFEVGLDPIVGIVPGGGDAVTAVGSLYIVFEAARAGVPTSALKKMLALVVVDLVAGSIPVIGVAFDAVWKANEWNVATFEDHVDGDAA